MRLAVLNGANSATLPSLSRARKACSSAQRCSSRFRTAASNGDEQSGAPAKGFTPKAAPSTATPTPAAPSSSKASMKQYRKVMAAEQEAKASREAASPSTSGRASTEIEETPVVVSDRMLQRMIVFSGVPVLIGFCFYPLFYYLKVVQQMDIPMAAVYVTQVFTFGAGLAGISYAVLSTSWDANQPGSLLGWTELQGNLPLILDRFKRK